MRNDGNLLIFSIYLILHTLLYGIEYGIDEVNYILRVCCIMIPFHELLGAMECICHLLVFGISVLSNKTTALITLFLQNIFAMLCNTVNHILASLYDTWPNNNITGSKEHSSEM